MEKSKYIIKNAAEKNPISKESVSLITDFGWSKSGRMDENARSAKAEML